MRRVLFLILGLVPVVVLLAGCTDGSIVTYSTGSRPVAVVSADVNADGRPDLVVLDAGSGSLMVRLQGAHGYFDQKYTMPLPKGAGPVAMVEGTFRSNGKPTVVVANRGDDSISIFNTFAPGAGPTKTVPLGDGAAPEALAVGDVDGDGDADLLVTSREPTFPGCPTKGCLLLFKDKGDGLAYGYAAYPMGTDDTVDYDPVSVSIGQIWGTARPEIAVVNKGTNQAVVIDTKNTGFETASSYTTVDVTSPTKATISDHILAVESATGDGAIFAPGRSAGTLTRMGKITSAGFLYQGGWVKYDPTTGTVKTLANDVFTSPDLKNITGFTAGEIDGYTADPDFAGVKSAGNSVAVFLSSHPWSSPDALDLGKVAVGSTHTSSVTGQLSSNRAVNVVSTVTGPDASSFHVANCAAINPPGGRCKLAVTFAPTSPGVKHATVQVETQAVSGIDNSGGISGGQATISLTGTATAAAPPTPTAGLVTGVADDYGRYASDGGAWFFSTLRGLGMTENRMVVTWQPGATALSAADAAFLDRSIAEAQRQGVAVVLSIYPAVASQDDPNQFCAFAQSVAQRYPYVKKIVVGNEPNKADFWSPVSPAAYTQLLARCYDVLHPLGVTVIGGALSARKVGSGASPVEFLAGMGAAYRALGRSTPIMDELSFHPYPNPDRIAQGMGAGYEWPNAGPPDLARVEQAFEDAFAGTGQPTFSSSLRMMIDEIGWQATIAPQYAGLYTGTENSPAVDESQQAQFYADAVGRYECDPHVSDLLLLHLVDETQLNAGSTGGGWQSGLLRADLSQRPAFAAVRGAIAAGCTGAATSWTPATGVVGGSISLNFAAQQVRIGGKVQKGGRFTVGASAEEGVDWTLTIKNADGKVVATRKGIRTAPFSTKTFIPPVLVGSGSYTATMTMSATLNAKRTLSATKTGSSS